MFNFSSPTRQLFDDDLMLLMSIFNEDHAKDKFIVNTPDLHLPESKTKYAEQIGINEETEKIHLVLNLRRRENVINTGQINGHWVWSCIVDETSILFGDPLGSTTTPSNLVQVLKHISKLRSRKKNTTRCTLAQSLCCVL